jgi:hypothetical protein
MCVCARAGGRVLGLGGGGTQPFKYAVSAVIMQRNGAGMTSASSCYWDSGNSSGSS